MHVHLPKELHGSAELAKEIAIIVVGVLIALFFEQIVQRWDWQQKVAAATLCRQFQLSTSCSAVSAISTPTTMIAISFASSRQS